MVEERRKEADEAFRCHTVRHRELVERTAELCAPALSAAADLLEDTFRRGGKLLLCGNGGSAADCQHLATEFMCRLRASCQRIPFPAVARFRSKPSVWACQLMAPILTPLPS